MEGPQGVLTFIVQMIRSFFWDLRGREKNRFKKSCLHDDRKNVPNFPGFIKCNKAHETIYKGPQEILTITVEFIRAYFQDLTGC